MIEKTLQKAKYIAFSGFIIAGISSTLLSPIFCQLKPVSAHPPYYSSENVETVSTKRITKESYDGIHIPNDTIAQKDLFGKNIVITIDDCYNIKYTRRLFETLKARNATATFFPNTMYLSKYNQDTIDLWREIYDSGFEIGYHSTNHKAYMSVNNLQEDFQKFTEHMRELLGDPDFSIKSVRPPYGAWDKNWICWVEQNELLNVRWNMSVGGKMSYTMSLIEKSHSPIFILHAKHYDTLWLEDNIDHLNTLALDNNSIVGSVFDSLEKNTLANHSKYQEEECLKRLSNPIPVNRVIE